MSMSRALGTSEFITLRGIKYQLKPLRLRHFAEAKAFLVSLAPDPLKELTDGESAETYAKFPPEVQKALALKALELREQRKQIESAAAADWINSAEGLLFLFWCMVRDTTPELATIQAVFDRFPLDNEMKELSIAEASLIAAKVDAMALGDLAKKKLPTAKREKKAKRKTRRYGGS